MRKFWKITQKCSRQLNQVRVEEIHYLEDILNRVNVIVCPLKPQQIHLVYEAVGAIVSAQGGNSAMEPLIAQYMLLPNFTWLGIINEAKEKADVLQDDEKVEQLVNILKVSEYPFYH